MTATVCGQLTKSQPKDQPTEKKQTTQDVAASAKEAKGEVSRIQSLIHDLTNIEDAKSILPVYGIQNGKPVQNRTGVLWAIADQGFLYRISRTNKATSCLTE